MKSVTRCWDLNALKVEVEGGGGGGGENTTEDDTTTQCTLGGGAHVYVLDGLGPLPLLEQAARRVHRLYAIPQILKRGVTASHGRGRGSAAHLRRLLHFTGLATSATGVDEALVTDKQR